MTLERKRYDRNMVGQLSLQEAMNALNQTHRFGKSWNKKGIYSWYMSGRSGDLAAVGGWNEDEAEVTLYTTYGTVLANFKGEEAYRLINCYDTRKEDPRNF